jgi:hypothetical protein
LPIDWFFTELCETSVMSFESEEAGVGSSELQPRGAAARAPRSVAEAKSERRARELMRRR